jgi:formylglycine-generating enzyme required for sulfatase activity
MTDATNRPLKVFLCYARSDIDAVRVLYKRLTLDGVEAWFDKESLLPGQDWKLEIRKAVQQSDVVVVCLSNNFNTAGFQQKEVRLALETADEKLEGDIFIIPVRLEECDGPESLTRWQWVDIFEKDGYRKLKRALDARAEQIGAVPPQKKGGASPTRSAKPKKESKLAPSDGGVVRNDTSQSIPQPSAGFHPAPQITEADHNVVGRDQIVEAGDGGMAVGGNVQGSTIIHAQNVFLGEQTSQPGPKANAPSAKNIQPQIKPMEMREIKERKSIRKWNTQIIVAVIGAAAVICAAVLGSLPWKEWLAPAPVSITPAFTTTSSIIPTGTSLPADIPKGTQITYTVQVGDTLAGIAVRFNVTVEVIMQENNLGDANQIKVGDVLIIPVNLVTPTVTPLAEITDSQGVTMRLVPAGPFPMGSDNGDSDRQPVHDIYLDAYYIDIYEVTNALYKTCVDASVCAAPKNTNSYSRPSYYGNPEFDNYPVIYVDWNMAQTYCQWRGADLPTEAQWEKAARGTDGRTYPWGEGIDCNKANYHDGNKFCVGDTTAVGNYPSGVSPYGLYDMAGNIWEWVKDWYLDTYYQNSPSENPLGPDTGTYRVLRGGSWYYDGYGTRSSIRGRVTPDITYYYIGFRCARSLP